MENQRYGVEYQPIICIKTQEIYAYECLSRFFNKDNSTIRPDLVYSSLHDSPLSLFQVEYQQKKLQLSYAPNQVDIFVNLDQDSYFSTGAIKSDNPFLKLFKNLIVPTYRDPTPESFFENARRYQLFWTNQIKKKN